VEGLRGPARGRCRRRSAARAVKELLALAIAVVKECDGCIAYHAEATARRGASERDVVEALDVALLMGGGPVSVYAPRAHAAFREFAAARQPAPEAATDST